MSAPKLILKKLAVVASFGMAATLMSGEHAEAADTATLEVDVTVASFCDIYASPISFLGYDPGAVAAVDTAGGAGAGRVSVDCTNGVPFTFSFGAGDNGPLAGPGTLRSMDGPTGDLLGYRLEAAGANTDLAVSAQAGAGNGDGYEGGPAGPGIQNFVFDGVIPAGQIVDAGAYHDNVVVTLAY